MAGYIGSKASVVSSGAERKKVFDITTTTTSLTGLSYTPNQVHVFHNGIRLVDGTDYTATNRTSITLTTAAENGDQVVVISYATFQNSDTVSASAGGTFLGTVDFNNTSHITIPRGTTAQRPGSPTVGMVRFNTDLDYLEEYRGGQWVALSNIFSAIGGTVTTIGDYRYHTFTSSDTFTVVSGTSSVEYLVVAGGGGGGRFGGGGGAGGYISAATVVSPNSYTVTVGAGGAGWVGDAQSGGNAGNGTNSSFASSTAIGGGGAGNYGNPTGSNGASGGSGGGAGISNTSGSLSGGSATSGQGNAGGGSPGTVGSPGGGGGGAGAAGTSGNTTGQGGNGSTWLNGTTYAGGGSGSQPSSNLSGGSGGGGTGFRAGVSRTSEIDGVANTGGGGGGGRDNSPSAGNGASGIVIIRYAI